MSWRIADSWCWCRAASSAARLEASEVHIPRRAVVVTTRTGAPNDRISGALVVMGVSGCGKSTLAEVVAERLGWAFVEADDLHSTENIARMSAGLALTDAHRQPWLRSLRDLVATRQEGVVLACSALRRSYRDVLREAPVQVHFVHLHGSAAELSARLTSRTGHFMPASLLGSQLAVLETLECDEMGLTLPASASVEELADRVLRYLRDL